MFELTVLGTNILLPSLVVLLGAAVAIAVTRPRAGAATSTATSSPATYSTAQPWLLLRSLLVGTAVTLALWAAVGLRNQFSLWPDDAWLRMPHAVALIALAAGVTVGMQHMWLGWLIRSLAVGLAAWMVFPTGESWDFLLPQRPQWLLCLGLSTLVAWGLVEMRPPRSAAVLGLSWIVVWVAAAYLTGQSFLSVTEHLMAISAVVGCLSLLTLWCNWEGVLVPAVGGCLFASSASIASAQFNSYLGLPDSLSWLAMSSPAIAAAMAYPFAAKRGGDLRPGARWYVTLAICCLVAGGLIAWTYSAVPAAPEW